MFSGMFSAANSDPAGGNNGPTGTVPPQQPDQRPNADQVFGDVFEDVRHHHLPSFPILTHGQRRLTPLFFVLFSLVTQLLRPEVERHLPLWTWLGAACGAGLGFITANMPGLVVGAYAGNRLGAIRDAKGKSVAAVFSELGAPQKVQVCGICVSRSGSIL